jgi:hypothetical protein
MPYDISDSRMSGKQGIRKRRIICMVLCCIETTIPIYTLLIKPAIFLATLDVD